MDRLGPVRGQLIPKLESDNQNTSQSDFELEVILPNLRNLEFTYETFGNQARLASLLSDS